MSIIGGILSILVGGGLLAFIQFLISRSDNRHDKLKEIIDAIKDLKTDVDTVREEAKRQNAVLARTHILRFDDELCNGVKHSKEYFQQQLQDIDTYEKFCESHHDFENSYAIEAIKHIRETFRKCRDEDKFI